MIEALPNDEIIQCKDLVYKTFNDHVGYIYTIDIRYNKLLQHKSFELFILNRKVNIKNIFQFHEFQINNMREIYTT